MEKIQNKEVSDITLKEKQKAELAEIRERQRAERQAEKEAEKAKKAAEKEAEKQRKEAEKAAEKERKEAEKARIAADREAMILQMIDDNKAAYMAKLESELGDEDKAISLFSTMQINDDGTPAHTISNLKKYVEATHTAALEEFSSRVFVDGDELTANRITDIAIQAEDFFYRWYNYDGTRQVLNLNSERGKYNAIKAKIESFPKWDGVKRVETFFIDRLYVEDTPLNREMSFKWLYAMIKRIYSPGCEFDHCLTVTGGQKWGKTKTFIYLTQVLSDDERSYTDLTCSLKLDDKDNILKLNKCVICFFDESNAIKYTNNDKFKVFVTANEFHARRPYDTDDMTFPSHMVIAVSTNDEKFLTDVTSEHERRHWILEVGKTAERPRNKVEWNASRLNHEDTIKQVWAELLHYLRNEKDAPYDITEGQYNELTADNDAIYFTEQKKFKTRDDDFVTLNAIDSVLMAKYRDVRYNTLEEMWSDFTDRNEVGKDKELDKIPMQFLYGMIAKVSRKTNSEAYLKSILNGYDGWTIQQRTRYGDRKLTCFVRDKYKIDDSEQETDVPNSNGDDEPIDLLEGIDNNNTNQNNNDMKNNEQINAVPLNKEKQPDFNKICRWDTRPKAAKKEEENEGYPDWSLEAIAETYAKYGDKSALL